MDANFGSVLFFTISLIFYFVSTVSYILYSAVKNEKIAKIATWLLVVGVVAQTIAFVFRTIEVKHAPFVTTYEAVAFWAWLIALTYLVLQFKLRIKALGALITPLAFLMLAGASLLPESYKVGRPLMPALQSRWLEFHIATCFIGYACFAVSFVVGLAYLLKRTDNPDSKLSKDKLDMIGYKSISVGFPFLTIGVIAGAMWANMAWGSYWQWDPKETWSLITWFIYAIYLHLRVVSKWKGKYSAIVSVIGFLAVVFTFFGVNFLLSGLHSYG